MGESTKFISSHLNHGRLAASHTVVEHDPVWADSFTKKAVLSDKTQIEIRSIVEKSANGKAFNGYENIENLIPENGNKFDCFIKQHRMFSGKNDFLYNTRVTNDLRKKRKYGDAVKHLIKQLFLHPRYFVNFYTTRMLERIRIAPK